MPKLKALLTLALIAGAAHPANSSRSDGRTARTATSRSGRRRTKGEADSDTRRDRRAAARSTADLSLGLHEDEDGEAVHDDPESVRACAASREITSGDVTVHTLRHTALSRMMEHGFDERQPNLPHFLRIVVDGRRLELPTSALRTRRSPN
jgi:hypothetical protein